MGKKNRIACRYEENKTENKLEFYADVVHKLSLNKKKKEKKSNY